MSIKAVLVSRVKATHSISRSRHLPGRMWRYRRVYLILLRGLLYFALFRYVPLYQAFASMPWQDITSTFVIPPASNQADINRYIDENLTQFVTGQKPINADTWNAFIKGLDGLNVSDWEAAAQKALQDKGLLPGA